MFRFLLTSAVVVASSSVQAAVYFDFGDSSQITPGNYNNIVVNPPGVPSIPNAIDETGAGTGMGVSISGFFNGSNTGGTTAPTGAAAIFHAQATRDNGFGHAAAFGANPLTPMGTINLTGLNPAQTYDFDFFGSRTGVTDNRETEYAVYGSDYTSVYLNASANTSNIATVMHMAPNANGEITINVDPGPNNNSASLFWYIGAMRVTADVPEPMGASFLLLGGSLLLRRRSTRR